MLRWSQSCPLARYRLLLNAPACSCRLTPQVCAGASSLQSDGSCGCGYGYELSGSECVLATVWCSNDYSSLTYTTPTMLSPSQTAFTSPDAIYNPATCASYAISNAVTTELAAEGKFAVQFTYGDTNTCVLYYGLGTATVHALSQGVRAAVLFPRKCGAEDTAATPKSYILYGEGLYDTY